MAAVLTTGTVAAKPTPRPVVVDYDSTTAAEYAAKWSNSFGLGEMAVNDTRQYRPNGAFVLSAVPFRTGADFSVFDHLKYIAISNASFAVPESGSLTFAVDIKAETPGTAPAGRLVHGCYGPPMSFVAVGDPCAQPYLATAIEGQQAGVVLNMVNFETGQLFDWFVSGNSVFALIERLPSSVTNPTLLPGDPAYVGLDQAYTQIIRSAPIHPGQKQKVSIRYTRNATGSFVEYMLNGKLFARVDNVGIPLDTQGVPFTGIYSSFGSTGEVLRDQLDSFVIGHGLFSLIDAYPFQHPERPDLSVSIPLSERLFGQGAIGEFRNFTVTTVTN